MGLLFFVAGIWDAINDPMMGMIVDNTRTKYGKFRIWITIGTLINSVFFILLFHSFNLSGTVLYVYVSVMYILYGMTYTIMDVPYWFWLPNLTNDPREREKVSVIPRFFASLAGFSVSTFDLYIINYFNKAVGEENLYAETGYTLFAIAIVAVFIITIGITVCNVKESPTIGTSSEKTSLKQAFTLIVKNDQLLAFIGLLLTFNLCTQIAKSFAVYYFKNVCGNEYLYSIFGDHLSYILCVLENGHLGQIYCGKKIHDKEDFRYLIEKAPRPMTSYVYENDRTFSLEHIRQEYPVYGSTDYRHPAVEILQENGSRISDFQYVSHTISAGKPKLPGLPATYTEADEEAATLCVTLKDPVTEIRLELLYTIFAYGGILARSARFVNEGTQPVHLLNAMSFSLDLPDRDYVWMQLSGAWARERHIKNRPLGQGILAIDSMRGNSSHEHNPFMVLKRPYTTETQGEALGFSFIYSGNYRIQAEVDTHDTTRITVGINPSGFDWKLESGETFQTPEAIMVYSAEGLNAMSQTFHRLYRKRLARGYWRDRPRPILNNNWEATYFDFTEDRLVEIAAKAKECGVELFVLDDGWFGKRNNDHAGLGDWFANKDRLPKGIAELSERIEALGMKFGLWFEPEMVNKDSDLYRAHPDWILQTPERRVSHGRNQFVLDFSRGEVVDCIYGMMENILSQSRISYIKWDMNRSITECYSAALPADRQGEVFHRYILGVYDLYERLTSAFPHVLFESCASGGGRFDPGLLYYAPQGWASDDSDAVERLKIQYGTSLCYPISSIGSHVSVSPNHQVFRKTPLHTRANVACFGTFGYELDLNKLPEEELQEVKEQISFMKEYREILQFGTFYRLKSPFEGNETVWMSVSEDKKTAIVGWYRVLNGVNAPYTRVQLQGLDPNMIYTNIRSGACHYGDELMNLGLLTSDATSGEVSREEKDCGDFESRIYIFKAKE